MINIAISYFYRIRFFTPTMVPLSTAMWDPDWFHKEGAVYIDKRGIINGYKFQLFVPTCHDCRGPAHCLQSPETCSFLRSYKEQLDKLDFCVIMRMLENIVNNTKVILDIKEELTLVLMVYEPPYKLCSERGPLVAWFKEHGYDLKEV